MAGLRCAQVLRAHRIESIVLEASDRVGGRIATDEIDGHLIDRGFQLLNPSYPQASRALDLAALDLRSFVAGLPGVPASGMQAIPAQMAASLPLGAVHLGCPVVSVAADHVVGLEGRLEADAVVLATALHEAAALAPITVRPSQAVTTWWFSTSEAGGGGATLVADREGDVLVNALEMTAAAPNYAPAGRRLFAASALGVVTDLAGEATVRARLGALTDAPTTSMELVAVSVIERALPSTPPPLTLRPSIEVDGVILAGDHVATPSIQGAMASGERAARQILARVADR